VCDGICKKLIVRHPHVFGDVTVENSGEVLVNWDLIKRQTKGQNTTTETLKSVPAVLPALMRSEKVQHRAAKSGFDYPSLEYALGDLDSEIRELKEAIAENNQTHIDEELGDLLFAAVNVSRFTHTDAENALSRSCEKFIARFEQVEKLAVSGGLDMKQASIEELDKLWKQAKKLV
jgi:tetrapyrrole methylase family protein/MazG family protein